MTPTDLFPSTMGMATDSWMPSFFSKAPREKDFPPSFFHERAISLVTKARETRESMLEIKQLALRTFSYLSDRA